MLFFFFLNAGATLFLLPFDGTNLLCMKKKKNRFLHTRCSASWYITCMREPVYKPPLYLLFFFSFFPLAKLLSNYTREPITKKKKKKKKKEKILLTISTPSIDHTTKFIYFFLLFFDSEWWKVTKMIQRMRIFLLFGNVSFYKKKKN